MVNKKALLVAVGFCLQETPQRLESTGKAVGLGREGGGEGRGWGEGGAGGGAWGDTNENLASSWGWESELRLPTL